jgi:hypothetical protein
MTRFRLRTLILAVAVVAVLLALGVHVATSERRIARLEARLWEAEARHLEYRARVEEMLQDAEIRVRPRPPRIGAEPVR